LRETPNQKLELYTFTIPGQIFVEFYCLGAWLAVENIFSQKVLSASLSILSAFFKIYQRTRSFYQRFPKFISELIRFISVPLN